MPYSASIGESALENSINTYFPYLMEIRRRLLLGVSMMAISAILGFIYYDRIITLFITAFSLQGVNIVFTSPFQYIELAMSSALLIGLISAVPFIIWQGLLFLKPALKPPEYRLILFMLPLSLFLFVAGFIFGVFMMKYIVIIFQQNSARLQVGTFLDISTLLSSILTTSALMGLAFQFPIVLSILVHFGIIDNARLARQRPWAYLSSFVFAMLLPPTDILSDILLTLPLVILFEFTLLLNWVITRAHPKEVKQYIKK